ncbi:MAG TPA: DUF6644 family protein [Pseudolabrys sp.]|nr:DUF6644 family protein [Pseudolabrys sp.]
MLLPFPRPINAFAAWLEQTPVSEAIASHSWVVPTVQSVHILGIATVATSALILDLRLLGVYGADQSLKSVAARFLPFLWWSLLVLLLSGTIMIVGEPPRSLRNSAFQLKMLLLIAAIAVTFVCQRRIRNNAAPTDRDMMDIVLAVVSMALWVGIIFAGRWIAYFT